MIYFIGAGPGAVDLITVRGAELLKSAQRIIYAGSLVNKKIIEAYAREDCEVYDSSGMTLEEITELLVDSRDLLTVRLHSGDPSIFGAVREQMRVLREHGVTFETVPGVSSLFAASSALNVEYTIPERSQTLIITRAEGRTPVPERENLKALAAHGSGIAVFLSASMTEKVCGELIEGGYAPETSAALVYKASWSDQKIILGTLATLPELSQGITKTALILVGDFLNDEAVTKSKLYDKNFSHEYRDISLHQEGR